MDKTNLTPARVFEQFAKINEIPRPSKHEEKIIAYLKEFGESRGLETLVDECGNVLIRKPGTKGHENRKTVVLQSHTDMVCDKLVDVEFDFMNDPIQTYIDGEWLTAKGTTLGADDGIGVAIELAILDSDDIEHGPIECLFTKDEETGLTGAENLQPGFLKGDMLINLDSEDEGQIFVSCAGGVTSYAKFEFNREEAPEGWAFIKASVKGLTGGHSGDDINKKRANAIKLLSRYLYTINQEYGLRLASFQSGKMHNAIPRDGQIVFAIATPVIEKTVADKIILALQAVDNGIYTMCQDEALEWLVETSSNIASVATDEKEMNIVASQRSNVSSNLKNMANTVRATFQLAGATVTGGDGYPAWKMNPNSLLTKIAVDSYKKLFNKEPKVLGIHAGLECGLFSEKYPNLDMVSFGPTLRYVHTPEERLLIPTVQMVWDHLLDILKNIPE